MIDIANEMKVRIDFVDSYFLAQLMSYYQQKIFLFRFTIPFFEKKHSSWTRVQF